MHKRESSNFRSETPGSPRPNSLYNATTTIDDLTLALANFSRVPSPEPPTVLECCCGIEDCANLNAWLELKSLLESRLILSAEIGQALLQRHEAYVRRHEDQDKRVLPRRTQEIDTDDADSMMELPESEIFTLLKEKALLEKRLNQALINSEVTEASSKTILDELQEARTTISRLTASHARSVGWENRLSTALKEKDDIQQERDGESNRAKLAESRLAAMKDKTEKLQSEVRRLQDVLEERRLHRLESSESILQDARARLDSLNKSQIGQTAMAEQASLTNVLESLVNDNNTLKHDNAELQNLLVESREETYLLQQEVEEHRANPPSRAGAGTPHLRPPTFSGSAPSSLFKEHTLHTSSPRSSSMEQRSRRSFEPLTPETSGRPLSPADSLVPSEMKWTTFGQPQPRYPSSHISIEIEGSVDNDDRLSSSPDKAHTHFSRSRGVQTEDWSGLASYPIQPYLSSSSPHDPRSESSSFSDSPSSNLSILLERMANLLSRLVQADALTLTNRLKRQHLKGADIGHLSRSTVSNILSEIVGLRTQFRFLLEDDRMVTPCTRKDFRVFFKLFKDIFTEMGEMRMTLNDVILDPAIAPRVSELALHPNGAEAGSKEKEHDNGAASGWMAPISKLFQARGDSSGEQPGIVRSASAQGRTRPPTRFVPKSGPALSASAMTVNVEFSGTGVGRPTTSTVASQGSHGTSGASEVASTTQGISPGVMDIFAGAPRAPTDPWVVLPKGPRRVQSFMRPEEVLSPPPLRRPTNSGRGTGNMLSREVDAVIDGEGPQGHDEESDDVAPLLQRTLRHRGLSDSSIHSTFMSHADESRSPSAVVTDGEISPRQPRTSVFRALSRTVQSFRITAGTTPGADSSGTPSLSPQKPSPLKSQPIQAARAPNSGHLHNLLPTLSWAAAVDPNTRNDPFLPGSFRDQPSLLQRTHRLDAGPHHREFF